MKYPRVNDSAYAMVTTPQNIVQEQKHFKIFFFRFLSLKRSCVGLISYSSNPNPPLLISRCPFRARNGGL